MWKFVLKEACMAVLLVVGDSRSGQDLSELLDVVEQRSQTQLAETAYVYRHGRVAGNCLR